MYYNFVIKISRKKKKNTQPPSSLPSFGEGDEREGGDPSPDRQTRQTEQGRGANEQPGVAKSRLLGFSPESYWLWGDVYKYISRKGEREGGMQGRGGVLAVVVLAWWAAGNAQGNGIRASFAGCATVATVGASQNVFLKGGRGRQARREREKEREDR